MGLIQYFQGLFKPKHRFNYSPESDSSLYKRSLGLHYNPRVLMAQATLNEWKNAYNEAITSYNRVGLYQFYEQAWLDDVVFGQIETRMNGTLAEPLLYINTANDMPLQGEAKLISPKLLRQLMFAILCKHYWGYSVVEFYEADLKLNKGQFTVVNRIKPWQISPERNIFFTNPNDSRTFVDLSSQPFASWTLQFGDRHSLGALLRPSKRIIFKDNTFVDWARLNERFGMPYVALKTSSRDDKTLNEYEEMLDNFGATGWGIYDDLDDLQIKESAKADAHKNFLEMINLCDAQMSRSLVGQTATADQKSYVGSAEVQERKLDWWIEADMADVQEDLNEIVKPFLISKGYQNLENVNLEFKYLYEQRKAKPKQEPTTQQSFEPTGCKHQEEADAYELFLDGLKKKGHSITFALSDYHTRLLVSTNWGDKCLWLSISFDNYFDIDDPEYRSQTLFNHYLKIFQNEVKQLFNVTNALPDDATESRLFAGFMRNAYEFAAAKSLAFQEKTKDLGRDDAKRYFAMFQEYAKTELIQFDLAVQAAREWQQIEANKDLFPNLMLVAVNDANTRQSHRALGGTVRPVDDAFWDTYYPPYAYRCRCSVRQLDGRATITPMQDIQRIRPDVPVGLQHNPGKTLQAFNNKHPYFGFTTSKLRKNIAEYAAYALDDNYKPIEFNINTAGYVVQHKKADKADLPENLKAAKVMAASGIEVEIREHKQNKGKNPELTVNGRISDLKTNQSENQLKVFINAFDSARGQRLTECVVLLNDKYQPYDADLLWESLDTAFYNKQKMKLVIVINKEKMEIFYRGQVDGNSDNDNLESKNRLKSLLK